MNLKTKKRIAREFLLIVGIIAVSLLIYARTFLYNGFLNWRIGSLKNKVDHKHEKLNSLEVSSIEEKEDKQGLLFSWIRNEIGNKRFTNKSLQQLLIQGHSVEGFYNFMKEQGIKNLPDKETFAKTLREDSAKQARIYEFLKKKGLKGLPNREGFAKVFGTKKRKPMAQEYEKSSVTDGTPSNGDTVS